MPRTYAFILALMLPAASCTPVRTRVPEQPEPVARLDRGLAASEAGRYSDARRDLTWVYLNCTGHVAGYRAAAGLAAVELDPRNPEGRPAFGTRLLGWLIQSPGTPPWTRPAIETGYLLAVALGAPPADASRVPGDSTAAGETATGQVASGTPLPGDTVPVSPDTAAPRPLPAAAPSAAGQALPGCGQETTVASDVAWVAPPLPALPGPSMAAILALAEERRDSLAQQLRAAQSQLDSVQTELERIRKTLKP